MDYADVYYIDGRNATVRDHTTGTVTHAPAGRVPARPYAVSPAASVQPYPAYSTSYPPTVAYPSAVGAPQWVMTPNGPQLVGAGGALNGSPLFGAMGAGALGGMGAGALIDLVAQIFAAVMPLPNAPNASDTETNTKNLITYQSALASYAKRDEQVRTIGSLLKKLVG